LRAGSALTHHPAVRLLGARRPRQVGGAARGGASPDQGEKEVLNMKGFAWTFLAAAAGLAIAADPLLDTPEKKAGYAVGVDIGRNFKEQGIAVDADALSAGVKAGRAGESAMSDEDMNAVKAELRKQAMAAFQKKQQESAGRKDENKAAGKKFMDDNRGKERVKETASGMQYRVLSEADGPKPKATDRVKVHYTGRLLNGEVFDSSVDRGEPVVFPLNGVIPGWTEGVQLMNVGSKCEFWIPSELAYGDAGAGGKIEPGATLHFVVELLGIENP
jgi:FKBP-type peptidyl-prolyl cis-trans isomerase